MVAPPNLQAQRFEAFFILTCIRDKNPAVDLPLLLKIVFGLETAFHSVKFKLILVVFCELNAVLESFM